MPKTVSATEAKNRLGALLGYVTEHGDDVIVENRGRPEAVIMSYAAYEEVQALRDQKRRTDALARLHALRERVIARNGEMSLEDAEAFAEEVTHEALRRLVARGEVRFERDRSS